MYSYKGFKPGSVNSQNSRIINYIAQLNASNSNNNTPTCLCNFNKYDKNTPGSDSYSAKVSYATRITQLVNLNKGGSIQYGNFYLGEPLNVNYLGRMAGMPGGSGMPPLNRF
jgi:hypothetical protein